MKEKVKIFCNESTDKVEESVNNWISSNDIEIVRVLQSGDKWLTISIFYTEKHE
jgi:hypothetical protein